MAENKFRRYLWLLSTIKSFGPLNFEDINYYWHRSTLNEDGVGLPKKTFFNHCQAISEIFNIDIICDRKNGYKYYIDECLQADKWQAGFLNELVIQESISENPLMRDKILDLDVKVEPKLPLFVNLIKDRAAIRFRFFTDLSALRKESGTDEPKDIEMQFTNFFPLGLIQAERTWFVIGLFAKENGWRRYSVYKVEDVTDISVIPDKAIPDYPLDFTPQAFLDSFEYPNDYWFDETDLLLLRLGADIPDKVPWTKEVNKPSD